MNINIIFTFLAIGLFLIFYLFEPMDIEPNSLKKSEVALLDLNDFTIYEYSERGLDSILNGKVGVRYADRYDIEQAKFNDFTKPLKQTLSSDFASYKGDVIALDRNVRYVREDGLRFESDEATYNQKQGLAKTKGSFVVYQDTNRIDGKGLRYDSSKRLIQASKVHGIYNINEQEKR